MNKAYSRINFQNAPSTATPLNATNLNKMDKAINDLDDRIIELSGYQEEAEESAEMASASASAAAKAAETATADAEARVNAIIEGLEVYTKEESDKKFASVIKQVATGSPILIKDGAGVEALDFKGKGRSTQNGTPTPDSPIAIESVADSGYFDGELLQGVYSFASGVFSASSANYVCSKNPIPCNPNDKIVLKYDESVYYIGLVYYDENLAYVGNVLHNNKSEINVTVPSNAKFFRFNLGNQEARFDLANAKHITVTINGKYALIVKSKGKNLLSINERDKATTFFDYTEYTNEIVKGSAIPTTNGTFLCSYSAYLEKGKTYTFSHESIKGMTQVYIYYDKLWGNLVSNLYILSTPNYTHNVDSGIYIIGYYSAITSGTEYSVVKPMLRRAEVTDGTYEPYKEEVKYIPLNEPLRGIGSASDEVSLTKVTRRFTEVVFDGSSDEGWYFAIARENTNLFKIALPKKAKFSPIICSHFKYYSGDDDEDFEHIRLTQEATPMLAVWMDKNFTTSDDVKSWLQANPITVIYELAEPITETIEPVDIVTYDNVTYLTASDNADMEVTYATDTKSYIDSKFAELHAALVNML